MGPCPGCGGQFRGDPGFRERDFIIARGSHLIIMGEREEKEISKIGTTGPAQVSVREPENGRITGMVARTAIPSLVSGVRAELDHSERRCRPWIGVTMETCSDKRIRKRDRVLGHGIHARNSQKGDR